MTLQYPFWQNYKFYTIKVCAFTNCLVQHESNDWMTSKLLDENLDNISTYTDQPRKFVGKGRLLLQFMLVSVMVIRGKLLRKKSY